MQGWYVQLYLQSTALLGCVAEISDCVNPDGWVHKQMLTWQTSNQQQPTITKGSYQVQRRQAI